MKSDYYKNEETVNEYIKLAKNVDSQQLIKKLIPFLSKDVKILELGSGPGTDWNILSHHFNVVGSDYSPIFINKLKKKFPQGEFLEIDAIEMNTNQTFDGIYSNKVLHHLSNQELIESINNQLKVPKPNGVICHSFWKGDGEETFKGMYVNYHQMKDLKNLFSPSYKILLLEEYEEFEPKDSIILIATVK